MYIYIYIYIYIYLYLCNINPKYFTILNFLIYYPFIKKKKCLFSYCIYSFILNLSRYCLFKNHHLDAFLIETFDYSDVPV